MEVWRKKTSIWKWGKFEETCYTEFDFLAVLEDSPRNHCVLGEVMQYQNDCPLCMRVKTAPFKIHIPSIRCDSKYEDKVLCSCGCRELLGTAYLTADSFLYELNKCLISSCKCYKMATAAGTLYRPYQDHVQTGCHKCIIEMSTGFLKVLFPPNWDMLESKCSAAFQWTSRTKSLYVPDVTLQRNEQVSLLPIHVDFLPVIEVFRSDSNVHDCFLVPKLCSQVREVDSWKKSSCMAEMFAMTNQASVSHIKAYKVMKYIVALMKECGLIKQYQVKIIALRHFESCTAASKDFIECIFEMFHDLQSAYEMCRLDSYGYEANLLCDVVKEWRFIFTKTFKRILETLCYVREEDTWSTYMLKVQKVAQEMKEEEEKKRDPYDAYEQSVYDKVRFDKLTSLVDGL